MGDNVQGIMSNIQKFINFCNFFVSYVLNGKRERGPAARHTDLCKLYNCFGECLCVCVCTSALARHLQ